MEVSDIGTGNGSSGFTCRISPADEVGIIENLLERIRNLETKVARLAAGNVETSQLSNISQQVGWATGITYMGTEGWIRTEAGTLIPPPGWTLSGAGILMSDGTPYQGVVMDENGVLQFGWMTDGTFAGEKVDEWNNSSGGSPDHYVRDYNYSITKSSGITQTLNTFSFNVAGSHDGNVKLVVSRNGIYHVSAYAAWEKSVGVLPANTVLAGQVDIDVGGSGFGAQLMREYDIQAINSVAGQVVEQGSTALARVSAHHILVAQAGQDIEIQINLRIYGAAISSQMILQRLNYSVVRLGSY
jgi:hypothetical protein